MMKKLFFFLLMVPFLGFAQGSLDFEGAELSTAYSDGTIDAEGITYTYSHCRGQDDYPIDGQGLMLRRASDSYLEWTVDNGIGELTFEYRKAFTGGSPRQLEVLVNGEQVNVSDEFGEGSGEQEDVYTLVTDIDEEGEVTIRIKNVGDASGNKQSVIDNISWTAFGDDGGNNNGGDDELADAACEPSYSSGCGLNDLIKNLTLNGDNGTSIEDMDNDCDDLPGTEDRIGMFDAVDLTPTYDYDIEIVSTASGDYASAWIDFNNDGEFSESEKVGSNTSQVSYETTYSGYNEGQALNIEIPGDVEPGVYRMRVVLSWNGAPDDACGSYSYGNYFDYKVNVLAAPDCIKPSEVVVSDISATGATVSWNALGEDAWDIYLTSDDNTPDEDTEPTIENVSDNTYALEDLTSNTLYQVYVRANCDDGASEWTSAVEFTTACEPTDIPFSQNFNDVEVPELPNCGSIETIGGSNSWKTGTDGYGVPSDFTGNYLLYSYETSNDANAWYFTQGMNLEAGVNYEISYLYGNNSETYTEKMKVAMGTSPDSEAMDEILVDYDAITGGVANEAEITFSVDEAGVYYFGFHAYSEANNYYLLVDDIAVNLASDCPRPSDLQVSNISEDSAEVSWTAGSDETEWDLYVVEAGSDAPEADTEATHAGVTDNPYTLEDLEDNTAYNVYVRAVCAEDSASAWRGATTFTTTCVPQSIPFFEGFEEGFTDAEDVAGCWEQEVLSGGQSWKANEGDKTFEREAHSGDWYASLMYGGDTYMMIGLDLEANTTYELKFYAKQDATSGASVSAAYGSSTDVESMTTIVESTEVADEWMEITGEFTPSDSGVYYVAIGGELSFTPWYLVVDDISVEVSGVEPNDCAAPEGLVVEDITEDSAFVIWEPGMDPEETDGWELAYGPEGFDLNGEDAVIMDVEDPLVELTDLEENTAYDVYVRTVCGEGEYSDWEGPVNFTTLGDDNGGEDEYCVGEDFETDFGGIASFVTSGAQTDIENTDIENPNGYNDFTDMVVAQSAGGSFEFTVDIFDDGILGDAGVAIYIDYNNDFEFGDGEMVYTSDDYVTSANGTISIPADLEEGTYRMRVVSDWLSPSPGACDAGSAMQDYTLQVGEAVEDECEDPTDLVVDEITDVTAVASWTAGGDESAWGVIYGEAGFTPDMSDYELVNEPLYTMTDLTPETDYEVYVFAICNDDPEDMQTSDLVGPVGFTTDEDMGVDSQIFASFNYYPNPVENQLNLTAANTIEKVEVFNMLGQLVIEVKPGILETVINTDGLSSGMYLMNVSIDGSQKSFRIVKK